MMEKYFTDLFSGMGIKKKRKQKEREMTMGRERERDMERYIYREGLTDRKRAEPDTHG